MDPRTAPQPEPPEAGPALPPRFTDLALAGEGAFGRVWRATDEQGRPVAVKVLASAHRDGPETLWQFSAEFRRLARLAHPAFPQAREEGLTDDGAPYYAMEWVAGEAPAGPMPAPRVRALLGAIAGALAHLHGLGLVHGDLKPENLRVAGDTCRVLDVGLMASVGQRREAIAGTLEYLAPEALRLAPVAPQADMYALGALGYTLWTGHPPFSGGPAELVRAQLSHAPTPPAGPDADPELARLLLALLAKAPAERPGAAGVLAALGLAAPEAIEGRSLQPGALVGREAMLARAREVLGTPGPAALILWGAPGAGKTRSLEAARLEAMLAGRVWFGARASGPAAAPAAPLRALVAQVLARAGHAPEGPAADWLTGQVGPELLELEPAARRAAMHQAAARALAAAAHALGGLALGLDDWHLADAASREALAALRRADAPIAWFIASLEADEADALALAPFDEAEARAYLDARLGAPAPAPLFEALWPASGGNPLALALLLEHLVGSGQLVPEGAGWRYAPGATAGHGPAVALGALWAARRDALSAPARRLAEVAMARASAGDLPKAALAAVAGLAPVAADEAFAELAAAGLLAVAGGRAHPAVSGAHEVFLAGQSPEARGAIATDLARHLVAERPVADLPLDALTAAAELALDGPDDAFAAALAGEAGRRSLALSATGAALRLLRAASDRLGADAPVAERLAVWLPRADAERFTDAPDAARDSYATAIALADAAGDAAAGVDGRVGLSKCRQLGGDYEGALAALDEAEAASAELGDAARQARVALTEARLRLYRGESAGALACAERAERLARGAGARALLAQALNLLGVLSVQADLAHASAGLARLAEAMAIGRAIGDGRGVGVSLDNLGNAHLALGNLDAASAAFGEAAQISRALGSEVDALFPELNQAIAQGDMADHPAAGAAAARVARRAEANSRRFPLAAARAVQAQAAWRSGRPDEAAGWLDEALATAQAIQNRYLEEFVRLLRLEAWLALGELEAARAEAEATTALNTALGHTDVHARLAVLRAELALQAGDMATAQASAQAAADSPNRLAAHRAHGALARHALASGDAAGALAHAESARAIAAGWGAPWLEAADAALAAQALRQADRTGEAVAEARRAMALADGTAPNPYARAMAARLLAELAGEHQGLAAAVAALRGAHGRLGAERGDRWLAAHGLAGLMAHAPTQAALGLDASQLAVRIGELALHRDEAAIGDYALASAVALTGADRGFLLLYDEFGRLARTVSQDMDAEAEVTGGFSRTIAEHVLFTAEPLYLVDAASAEGWREAASIQALALRTVIALPLATPATILGVLYMDRTAIEPLLGPPDVALLGAFAAAAADAIVRERELASARAATLDLQAQLAVAMRLAACGTLNEARRVVLEAVGEAAGAERGLWLVPDGAGGNRPEASWGDAPATTPVSRHVTDWVAERGAPLAFLDVGAAEGWSQYQSIQAMGLRTIWCLPAGTGLIYLDAARLADHDPETDLPALMALLTAARPLLARLEG